MINYLKARFTKGQSAVICVAVLMLLYGFAVNMLLSVDMSVTELNYTIPIAIFILGAALRYKLTFVYEVIEGGPLTLLISSFAVLVLGAIFCLDGTDCLTPLLLVPLGCVAMSNKEREGCMVVFTLALFGTILLASLLSLELSKKLYTYMFLLSPVPIILQAVISADYKNEKGIKYKGRRALNVAAECSLCLFIICFLLYSATMTRKSEMFNIISSFLWISPSLPKIFSRFRPLSFDISACDPNLRFLKSTGEAFGYIPYLFILLLMLAFLIAGLRLRKEKQRGIWQDFTVCMLLVVFLPMLSSVLYEGDILIPFFSNNLLVNTVNAVVLVLAAFAPEESNPILALERAHIGLAANSTQGSTLSCSSVILDKEGILKYKNTVASYFTDEYEDSIYQGLEKARSAELAYIYGDLTAVSGSKFGSEKEERLKERYVLLPDEECVKLRTAALPNFIVKHDTDVTDESRTNESAKTGSHEEFRDEIIVLSIYDVAEPADDKEDKK